MQIDIIGDLEGLTTSSNYHEAMKGVRNIMNAFVIIGTKNTNPKPV